MHFVLQMSLECEIFLFTFTINKLLHVVRFSNLYTSIISLRMHIVLYSRHSLMELLLSYN